MSDLVHPNECGDPLQFIRVWLNESPHCRLKRFPTRDLRISLVSGLIAVCFVVAQCAHSQEAAASEENHLESNPPAATEVRAEPYALEATVPALDGVTGKDSNGATNFLAEGLAAPWAESAAASEPRKRNWFNLPGQSEIIIEGLMSYGNYRIFASGYYEKLYTAGVEYDRHSWGYLLKGELDYVGEFLPFVLLNKPLSTDIWGNPSLPVAVSKTVRENVPGIGLFPIGFRLQWRNKKRIRPYLEAKGGILVFAKKVPSSKATYENFSLQSAGGVQVKMSERWGLRLGLFSDFHFSDDFIVPVNPGLDVMNANLGLSYHF